MSRFAVVALLIACGNGSKPAAEQQKTTAAGGSEEKIEVPGAKGGPSEGTVGAARGASDDLTQEGYDKAVSLAQFHLKAEEGTLSVGKGEGAAGSAVAAEVKLAPGSGYKLATDYPIKLKLLPPTGVKLEKTVLKAGGRDKTQGDAQTLSEQSLAFAVKATPEAAGSYEIKGTFSFGVCEKDSCHPRTQPITIQVAAK